ncbi:MAG: DUF1559 domain-containing protein [Pirellulaceae bacterium]
MNKRWSRGIRRHNGMGFTLIELLVVIAIIGILVGLLFPAVQAVRESARRTQCMNNLKQQITAIAHFEEAQKKLPVGIRSPEGDIWSSHLLPFIEQNNLYQSLDFSADWGYVTNANVEACATYIAVFQCPSASIPEHVDDAQGVDGRVPCSYLACSSGLLEFESGPGPYLGDEEYSDGIFIANKQLKMRDIIDGASNTVMVGESLFDFNLWGPDNTGDFEVVDHWYIGSEGLGYRSPDNSWDVSEALGTTACRINAFKDPDEHIDHKELGYSSRHPVGAVIGYADGHIDFVIESIDSTIWSAQGTRANGETVHSID